MSTAAEGGQWQRRCMDTPLRGHSAPTAAALQRRPPHPWTQLLASTDERHIGCTTCMSPSRPPRKLGGVVDLSSLPSQGIVGAGQVKHGWPRSLVAHLWRTARSRWRWRWRWNWRAFASAAAVWRCGWGVSCWGKALLWLSRCGAMNGVGSSVRRKHDVDGRELDDCQPAHGTAGQQRGVSGSAVKQCS